MEQQVTQTGPGGEKVIIKKEFVCDPKLCAGAGYKFKVGKIMASGLSGFIAGVVVASIILIPWMFVLSKMCPTPVVR
jgi:hypothetical protein